MESLRIAHFVLDVMARIILRVAGRDRAQLAAGEFIRRFFPLLQRARSWRQRPGYRPDQRAAMMNRMLCMFTRIDPNFRLHVTLENAALLTEAAAEGKGVLVCTGHQRLAFAAHRALTDLGVDPVFVGLTSGGVEGWNWGHPDPIDAIDAGRADVLLRCASAARGGATLVAFVDYYLHPSETELRPPPVAVSPNAFTWAAREGVSLLFLASRVTPEGWIILSLERPPDDPSPRARAAAFARFLGERTGWHCIVRRPKDEARVAAPAPEAELAKA